MSEESVIETRDIRRRTIVKGAAWSVPVIAVAAALPSAAASVQELTLTLDPDSTCTAIAANARASFGGAPLANEPVTVTLSGGYTFAGGAASFTGTTDADGNVVGLPLIQVPAGRGPGTIAASARGATSTAVPLTAPATASSYWLYPGPVAAGAVPPGSRPLVGGFFLTGDGWIIDANGNRLPAQTTPIQNPDENAGRILSLNGSWLLPLRFSDGTIGTLGAGGIIPQPVDAVPLYGGWFLQGTTIIEGIGGQTVATDIAESGQPLATGPNFILPVRKTDGELGWWTNSPGPGAVYLTAHANVPASAEPFFGAWFRGADGRLYDGTTGQIVRVFNPAPTITDAKPVDTAGYAFQTGNGWALPVKNMDGTYGWIGGSANGVAYAEANVAAGSTPEYGAWFLQPDRTLYDATTGTVIGSEIKEIGQPYDNGSGFLLPVERDTAC
ncbi:MULTISPECIES: hypothetical protein [Bacteria]|uniref:hypothetical protein n=1 Tax=Bacteria TaxID=2 RepID=UPI003C7B09AC